MIRLLDKTKSNISLLLIIAVITGLHLLLNTLVVSRDTYVFIEQARFIQEHGIKAACSWYTQHPGYPLLLIGSHSIIHGTQSNGLYDWVLVAQLTTAFFRLLCVVPFYLLSILYFSEFKSFLAGLIVLFLPTMSHYGIDGLSDYPNLFFVLSGVYCVVYGSVKQKPLFFALAGLFSALAYIIRPEGIQVLVCGLIWLSFQLIGLSRVMSFKQIIACFVLIIGVFTVIAAPLIIAKENVFSKKNIFEVSSATDGNCEIDNLQTANIAPLKAINSFSNVNERISAVHQWYFFPFAVIGALSYIRFKGIKNVRSLYIILFYGINTAVCMLLYYNYDYLSKRHAIIPAALLCIFIPQGAIVVGKIIQKGASSKVWLWIIFIGIIVCLVRFVLPLNSKHTHIFKSADWVLANTCEDDIVAVVDPRIALYSNTECVIIWDEASLPEKFDYLITEGEALCDRSHLQEIAKIEGKEKSSYIYKNTQ